MSTIVLYASVKLCLIVYYSVCVLAWIFITVIYVNDDQFIATHTNSCMNL